MFRLLVIGIGVFFAISESYADVPYEVFKTKTTSETTKYGNYELIVEDGKIMSDSYNAPGEGQVDSRIKTRLSGIDYKLEFWNVGKMGNAGWANFGGYEKATFTISFDVEKSFHMHDTGVAHPMFPATNFFEEVDDETRYIDDLVFDLTFTGGPYGKFTYQDEKGTIYQIGDVVDGRYVQLENFSYNMVKTSLGLGGGKIPVEMKMFGKWMEKLNDTGCVDSGIRFSDYNGEVMIRPDSDEDAWYGADLDIVLCVDDHIKTGDDSMAVLSLSDMTTFIMKSESELILSTPPKKESKLKLIGGKILVNIKRMLKDGTMDVEMSQAVAGARGTIFELEETGTESKIKVFEGAVEFKHKATGETSLVSIWETQNATTDGLSEKTTREDKEVLKVINKERQEWMKIKEPPLKPLLSEEEIAKINIKDPDRGEIKLDPDSEAPDGADEGEQVENKTETEQKVDTDSKEEAKSNSTTKDESESSNALLYIILIAFGLGFYYYKVKGKKEGNE